MRTPSAGHLVDTPLRPRAAMRALVVSLAVMGCVGGIGADGNDVGVAPGPAGNSTTPGSRPGMQNPAQAPTCRESPPRTRMWRMTPEQYALTMKDLFGISDLRAADLPQDAIDAITGFSNGADGSYAGAAHVRRFLPLADRAADAVEAGLANSHPCLAGPSPDDACARSFVLSLGKRLFRRPLETREQERYFMLFREARSSWGAREAAGVVARALVLSPSFFHLGELGEPGASGTRVKLTPHELASALSYTLTDGPPAPDLLAAADEGRLNREGVEAFARKLARTDRARDKMVRFLYWQLRLHKLEDQREKIGGAVVDAMLADAEMFVSAVLTNEKGSLASLLSASFGYPDARVAPLYGVKPLIAGGTPGRVAFDPTQRFGIFTLVATLAAEHGPIHRGRAIREFLMCQSIPLPGEDVVALINDLPAFPSGSTAFERWDIFQRERPVCAGCHHLFEPLGVAFDAYDDLGRHRTKNESGRSIRASGSVAGAEGWSGRFEDARDLVAQLAASAPVRACFARRYLTFVTGRAVEAPSDCHAQAVARTLTGGAGDLGEMMVAATLHESFVTRTRE